MDTILVPASALGLFWKIVAICCSALMAGGSPMPARGTSARMFTGGVVVVYPLRTRSSAINLV